MVSNLYQLQDLHHKVSREFYHMIRNQHDIRGIFYHKVRNIHCRTGIVARSSICTIGPGIFTTWLVHNLFHLQEIFTYLNVRNLNYLIRDPGQESVLLDQGHRMVRNPLDWKWVRSNVRHLYYRTRDLYHMVSNLYHLQ
jgi:hypothetical protein